MSAVVAAVGLLAALVFSCWGVLGVAGGTFR